MSVRNQPILYVIWCDDIRLEMGNKPSFMGVYAAGLGVQSLPTKIPRLYAHAFLHVPFDISPTKIDLRVELSDGTSLVEAVLEGEMPPEPPQEEISLRDPRDLPLMRTLQFDLGIGDLELKEDTHCIRMVAKFGDQEVRSYPLRVFTRGELPSK